MNLEILRCPCSKKSVLIKKGQNFYCKSKCFHSNPNNGFKFINNKPVLISDKKTDTIFKKDEVKSRIRRKNNNLKIFFNKFKYNSKTTDKNIEVLVNNLSTKNKIKILIIGSGTKGNGLKKLFDLKNTIILGMDVYISENVDLVADAHYLPFSNNVFDIVIIQAVLEHVIQPQVVADEIHRVLKVNGQVYAETPFMQQVHEGPYDYQRFTLLGHLYLFKKFKILKYGGNRGPEEVLAWSFKYFILALFRSRFLANIIGKFLSILLSPLGPLMDKRAIYDSSSGVYFLGLKTKKKQNMKHKDLPIYYKGMIN